MPEDRTRIENPSAFGRLANSLSWEGIDGLRKFRQGGVGRSDVFQAEVLHALDMLPRQAFLGTLLERAHGADAARAAAAAQVEQATLDLSVHEIFLTPAARAEPSAVSSSPTPCWSLPTRSPYSSSAQSDRGRFRRPSWPSSARPPCCVPTAARRCC